MTAVVTAVFTSGFIVKAQTASAWISSDLFIQKQVNTQLLPNTLNGNIDCIDDGKSGCTVPTLYGVATQNSQLRLNGTPDYLPVISNVDNRQHFLPISNSSTAITYTADPVYGFNLYFNYNFSSSLTLETSGADKYYKVSRLPDAELSDKSNQKLAADYSSISFSSNGQWMVVSEPNVAMLRINLQTFEVTPFAAGFNYSIGLDPAVQNAISNDGRYAVVGSNEFNRFEIYDISTCSTTPGVITGPVPCQNRSLKAFMNQQAGGDVLVNDVRFLNDDTLSLYGTSSSTARYILSNSSIISQIDYLALGDSFISGEGAFNYQATTDLPSNGCHLSLSSYPYLIGNDLGFNSYHSVACSGAVAADIYDTSIPNGVKHSQAKLKTQISYNDEIYTNFLPGYRAQLDFVTQYQPRSVVLSVGGNDMGFSAVLRKCLEPGTCYGSYEDRLELVRSVNYTVYPRLLQTYQKLKATGPADMRLYIIGYPQIAKTDGNCAVNVHLNQEELYFAQQIISYLDDVVKLAADKSGAYYVNTQDSLDGHKLCEAEPGSVAVNALTSGNDAPGFLRGPFGNESYHPNAFGHQLLENTVLSKTHNLTNPMPVASSSYGLPSETNLDFLNINHTGRTINSIEYEPTLATDFAYQQTPIDIEINGAQHALAPNTVLKAEIHSDSIGLGSFTNDIGGNLLTQLAIPGSVPAGYHSLHFYGIDIFGQAVDIYKDIYIAKTADDIDGDNTSDSSQKCVGIEPSNQDYDQDGLDDACDGNIGPQPTNTNKPTSATASLISTDADAGVARASQNPTNNSVSSINTAATIKTQPSSPKVLGASTSKPALFKINDSTYLKIPTRYFVYLLCFLLVSSLFFSLI